MADVIAAAEAIASHLERGGLDDGLIFDAVRVRLIEIAAPAFRSAADGGGRRRLN